MRMLSLAGLQLLLIANAAHAQWEPLPEVLRIEGAGEGAWTLSCQMQSKKGEPVTRNFTGRSKKPQGFSIDEPMGGSCTYTAAADTPLTISLRSPWYVCPLTSVADQSCTQVFAGGTIGSFEIKKKARP